MAQYGVFRGVIVNSADPRAAGRVQVSVPGAFSGNAWALVCTAFGAPRNTAPSVGTQVLVAFEGGNVEYPVVLGAISG